MGILGNAGNGREELKEIHRTLTATIRLKGKKSEEKAFGDGGRCEGRDGADQRLVCVTSGASYLGLAIVYRLLSRGYSVRLALENEDDVEKFREIGAFQERSHQRVSASLVTLTELDSLCKAFDGCHGVFHTSCFADPSGVSGYSKWMAELEHKASRTVIEACIRTASVRKCIFTSSLLACVWRSRTAVDLPRTVDESCWSDEGLCREKELWFALGKTMAERAAWTVANKRDVQLVTLCPALVTGPMFYQRNSTASIAYLKGARDMCKLGLLATVDISSVAQAHVCVYEETEDSGRYVCFDRVVDGDDAAVELERRVRMAGQISGSADVGSQARFELSNRKLSTLVLTPLRCSDYA